MRKKLVLITCAMALCAVAPAQIQNSIIVPGVKVTKTKDQVEKKVKRGVNLYAYKGGQLLATRSVDMCPDPRSLVDKKLSYAMHINLDNVFVEHLKVRSIPDPRTLTGQTQKVRGASNATRTVYNVPFQELDIYQGADRKNSFGGELDFSNCRLGDNHVEVAAFTKHAEHIELGLLFGEIDNTKWRRNSLDDGLDFIVTDMPERDLYVEMARNGWHIIDPELNRMLKALARAQDMTLNVPSGSSEQIPEKQKVLDDNQKAEANASAKLSYSNQLDLVVKIQLNSKDFDGGGCRNGDKLVISSNRPFQLEVYCVTPGEKDRLVKKRVYDSEVELKIDLPQGKKYRIDLFDSKNRRLIGTTTLEVGS